MLTKVTFAVLPSSGDASTAAVLTPYRGQVRALQHAMRLLAPHFEALQVEVTVSSVDGYQGREADVIVFTTVRWVGRVVM